MKTSIAEESVPRTDRLPFAPPDAPATAAFAVGEVRSCHFALMRTLGVVPNDECAGGGVPGGEAECAAASDVLRMCRARAVKEEEVERLAIPGHGIFLHIARAVGGDGVAAPLNAWHPRGACEGGLHFGDPIGVIIPRYDAGIRSVFRPEACCQSAAKFGDALGLRECQHGVQFRLFGGGHFELVEVNRHGGSEYEMQGPSVLYSPLRRVFIRGNDAKNEPDASIASWPKATGVSYADGGNIRGSTFANGKERGFRPARNRLWALLARV